MNIYHDKQSKTKSSKQKKKLWLCNINTQVGLLAFLLDSLATWTMS